MEPLGILFALAVGITLFVLVLIFVVVPLFRGLASVIGWTFSGIGWLIVHIFEFIGGMISDTLRLVGAIIAMIVLMPLAPLNVVLGRWSAAGHFAESVKREFKVAGACVYRVCLHRPLKLVWLHGILEGLEQRVPEAMAAAPGADKPSRRSGQFDGYTIVGSLRGGGSGAKLYIAKPDESRRGKGMPDRVVIKSFALTDGSSLPQIVRESRALEAAKQLGLVLEHGMDNHRFFYIMPYHPGEHLGIVTRQLHAEAGGRGLGSKQLGHAISYARDLLGTLAAYHSGGLWHKDVKPENVIIKDGQAHLVDLGLVTPLRSAMTLTTHGTEYFRDPEMVRQALRGVKVHQVDGAKFDVFATGAVLYFMLENTFPAHGGLSRFTRKSPESLRWIIRRAMTDYDKRYESANAMLADLAVVAAARDPYDVKPAALPSMGGEEAPVDVAVEDEAAHEPQVVGVAAAGSPRPPADDAAQPDEDDIRLEGFGLKIEAGRGGVKVANLAGKTYFDSGADKPPKSAGGKQSKSARPRLRVTNWWTGAYTVDDAGADVPAQETAAQAFRAQSPTFRRDADEIASRFRAGAISARKAAKEQIRAARQRATEIRRRAHERRHHRPAPKTRGVTPNQPTAFLGFLTLLFIVVGGFFGVNMLRHQMSASQSRSIVFGGAPEAPTVKSAKASLPALLVLDVDDPADPRWAAAIQQIVNKRSQEQYDVIVSSHEGHEDWRTLLAGWRQDPSGPIDALLEDRMEAESLYAFIYARPDEHGHISETVIFSTREGAEARRRPVAPAPDVDLPLVLINDHPTKVDPLVAARVQQILDRWRVRGWTIIPPDESLEALVLAGMRGRHDPESLNLSPQVQRLLVERDFGGVFWIGAKPGDAAPLDRLHVMPLFVQEDTVPFPDDWDTPPDVDLETIETPALPG
jgi:serine/threonine protein kinase